MKLVKEEDGEIEKRVKDSGSKKTMAKKVVTELVSQIPLSTPIHSTDEKWNCGMDCRFYNYDEERDVHKCKGRKSASDPIIDWQKRCPYKKLDYRFKIRPDWLDEEFDNEDNLEVPKKK